MINILITRDDDEQPILWALETIGHNGKDKVNLYLNQDELEQLQDGINDLLHNNSESFEMEIT